MTLTYTPSDELSARQRAIYGYIVEYVRDHRVPPAIREIADACDISSTSVVAYNLAKLGEKGFLARVLVIPEQARSWLPVRRRGEPCPLCGCGGGH